MKLILVQLLTIFMLNLCIAQNSNGINCPNNPVYTNTDFTLTVNSNFTNATCEWKSNGQTVASGNSFTTQINAAGEQNFSVTCCIDSPDGGDSANCERCPCANSTLGSERRVSNNSASPGQELYHRYSRGQAYNADETKFILTGSGTFCFDRATGNQVASLPITSENCWSDYEPDKIWGVVWSPDGNDRFVLMDVNNPAAAITYYSRPGCNLTIGDFEGHVQQDRRVVLRVQCQSTGTDELVSLDLSSAPATVLGTLATPSWFNWAGFCNDGSLIMIGSGAVNSTFSVLNPNFNEIWSQTLSMPFALQHLDFVTMPNGDNVVVVTTDQRTSYINLETQAINFLTTKQSNSGHISGLASKNCPGLYFASDTYPNQISYLHQLNSDMSVAWSLNLGNIAGGRENYEDQTKGTISPCGNYLLYSSPKSGTAEVYEISINNNNCNLNNPTTVQQECEIFVCTVTAVESNINILPTGCPTGIVTNGNISIEEPLPAGGASWLSSSPFWSCTQNGNNFDVTPYKAPPNPNAFTLVGLPAANYCCNFEATPLDANGNQLPTVYNQCCFTVGTTNQPNNDDCQTDGTAFANVATQSTVAWNAGNPYANRPRPALGVWEPGDVPGTEIMRVSDDAGNGLHYYNSRQVWNVDMTKMMIGHGGVDANRLLDVTNNYTLLPTRIPLNSQRVWSNTNPDLIYGIFAKTTLSVFNVSTGVRTSLYSRPSGAEINIRTKGNLPGDDSKIALYEPSTNTIISYNIQTQSVIAEIVWPFGNINVGGGHVTYDWSGNWITVGMNEDPRFLYRMKPDLTNITQVHNQVSHWDNAYNTDGESVRVQTRGNGSVQVVNFDDPNKNYISPIFGGANPANGVNRYTPDYLSGRGQLGAPGWVAFGGESKAGSPNHPLGLYKIDGNTTSATIKVIGYDHHSTAPAASSGGNDDRQKPSVSPDGNQVIFTSDWGVPNGPLSSYIIRGTGGGMSMPCDLSCIAAQSVAPSCGLNNGQATVTVDGGSSPYTYQWNNGQSNATAVGLAAGTYQVSVTDANSNTTSCSIILADTGGIDCNESTIYEAEAATLVGVTKANNKYTNISNGEYVTGFDEDGDQLIFNNVVAAEAGTYLLTIRYACSSYKENYVSVNGGAKENISFPTSAALTDKTIPINLNEGTNTITIEKHWGWFDVDYIKLDGTGNEEPPQPGATIRIEAESGVPSGVITQNNSSASAGQYVTNFQDDGDKITVIVPLENAGNYQLKVGYRSSSGEKKNDLYLNAMFLGNIQFLQSNTFTVMTVGDFYFDAGQNTIEFIKSWGWMDVDYFEVVAAANQNANSSNNVCERTIEIGYAPTANFYRAGTINSNATISANQLVEFIGVDAVNLKDGFEVKQSGDFSTDIIDCGEEVTCNDDRYISHTVLNITSQSIQLRMETAQNMPLRLSYYPSATPLAVQHPLCEYSFTYGANGNEHVQTISGLNAATEYTIIIQSSTDVVNGYSDCPNMRWEDISCPFQITTK